MQLLCYRLGIALPTVVAGDNLNFPVIGPFLQHAGAMWIRRSFGHDALYTTIVQAYIDTLLANGYNLECFIEGGRSRTGKLLSPKFGILSFLLDSVLSGRVDDAIICPVSTVCTISRLFFRSCGPLSCPFMFPEQTGALGSVEKLQLEVIFFNE